MYNVINTALYIAVSYASTTQSAICQDGKENFGKIDKKTKLFIVTYVAFRDEKVYNEVTIKYRKVYPFSIRRVQTGRIRSLQTEQFISPTGFIPRLQADELLYRMV